MVTESKYCSKRCNKIHFNKELVMTTDDQDFENSINCCICDNEYIEGDFQVRYHCYTSGKYRGSPHRHCNIKIKLNYKIQAVFHNLKNFDSRLIMKEVRQFYFIINMIPNGLEEYMSFNINDKFIFIDILFLSSSLDSLVKKGLYL